MRSYLSFLLIPLFGFGVFAGKASAGPSAVQSGFSARLSYVEGDVRLSLGREGQPYIGKEWVDASAGLAIQEGNSVATQEGGAEIEFENGSMVYLAPHSLLMLYDLTAHDPDGSGEKEFDTVGAKLLAGSLMFLSQFRQDGEFTLETQTARLRAHSTGLYRVTSYLNSTEIVDLSDTRRADLLAAGELSSLPQGLFSDGKIVVKGPEAETKDAWDLQVRERMQERVTLTLAALQASGLSAPFGGLVDLYKNGKFTPCGTNETCWEPSREALTALAMAAGQSRAAALPAQRAPQGQVVSESEDWEQGACESVWMHTTVWRDANGKLHRDRYATSPGLRGPAPWQYSACTTGEFVYTKHRHCIAFKRDHCHHHQHHEGAIHWAKVNGRAGIVRTAENGAKGKSGVNLKAGIYLPPQKPGEPMRYAELSATSKVALLGSAPKEYRGGGAENTSRVSEPTITAQFHDGHTKVGAAAASGPKAQGVGALHQASYDFKAHGFTIPGDAHPVMVARMDSYGAVSAPTGHNGSPGAVPGLAPAGHSGGGFGGSTGGGAGGHSSGGGGSGSGGGSSHSGGGGGSASSSASSAGSAAAGSHH